MADRAELGDAAALLTGAGRFIEDETRPGMLAMAVLRAPVAHGRIEHLDASAAQALKGVRLVLTAADPVLARIGPLASRTPVDGLDGPMIEPRRPVLADGRVVHVGQPVAAVVAESLSLAMDALEAIELDIEPLPAVTDPLAAQAAPAIWPEARGNLSFRWQKGNADRTTRLMAEAAHVVELTVTHPRIAVSPIEPRGCLAEHGAGGFTLTTPSQGVVSLRTALVACLGIQPERLRVLTRHVGGSFAAKIWPYPEHVLALVAARATGRPVRWIGTRTEAFVADAAGRGRIDRARLGLDAEGRFLAFEIDAVADMGAFLSTAAPSIVTQGAVRPFGQLYDIEGQCYRVTAVFTNAVPTDAYRGAGKPESAATLERLIETAAGRLGINSFELRQRNLIRPERLPLATPMGETMDAGDFPAIARRIRDAADWEGRAARKAQSRARGLVRGAAITFHCHATGGSTAERSEVRALADGTVLVRTSAQDSGQGHRAALTRVAAEALDLPPARVRIAQGDSLWLAKGGGTGGSNLMPVAATTVHRTALALIDRARAEASEMLEAAEADLTYGQGEFRIAGTDRTVGLAEIARRLEADDGPGCVASHDFEGVHTTWPNGAFACEVEIDPDTGHCRVDRLTAVNDIGRVIDDAGATGQIHGGLAQGVGEVLLEGMRLDSDGQPLSGSLMDYALPRAADLPTIAGEWAPTGSPNTPLGAKGMGELASIGAPGAVLAAVQDALEPGAAGLDMPLTAEKIWRALRSSPE